MQQQDTPAFGLAPFASAAGIDFSKLFSADEPAPAADPVKNEEESSSRDSSDEEKAAKKKRAKKSKKHKRERSSKHSRRERASHSSSDDEMTVSVPGLFEIDTTPDLSSMSFGTVLDAPLYKSASACVPQRYMLGVNRLSGMERQWLLSSSSSSARALAAQGVEYQIEGVDPALQRKQGLTVLPGGRIVRAGGPLRYYDRGAIPRARLCVANSSKRLGHALTAAANAAKTADADKQWAQAAQKSADLARHLEAALGTKVISFGGPVMDGPSGGTRSSLTGEYLGYIPMDPPGVDLFEEEEESGEVVERMAREQLAIQTDGLLTPAFGESVSDFVKRRAKQLNEATRDRPKDEMVWMELAAFQSVGIDSGIGGASRLRRRDAAVLDKQIAIYERAMVACPASVRIARALLRACQELKTREDMELVWKRCLALHPADSVLWNDFLSYNASLYSSFKMPAIRSVAKNALATIQSVQLAEAAQDRAKGVFVFEAGLQSAHYKRRAALLSTLNELAAIEAAGGHSEISIAHWQAVLEFALNAPSSVAPKPLPTRLKFFEAYWESDHPRIGDCDIVTGSGWSQWLQQKLAGVDSDAPQPSDWEPLQSRAAVKSSEGEVWGVLGVDETLGAVDEPEAPLSLYDALGGSSSTTETSADGSRIEMVYSALHGYRIPMRVGPTDDETTSAFYLKILGELREENGTAAAEAAKADKAARKTLKPAKIGPDDPFVEWLAEEDSRSVVNELPARSNPTVAVPASRIVYFEAIEGSLFDVGDDLAVELVTRALTALGVSPTHLRSSNNSVAHSMISKAVAPSALACVGVMGVASPFLPAACNSGNWSIAPTLSSAIVSTDLVNNPAKAKFVRNMFQSLFRMGVLDRSSTLMCTFVEFEGAIASVLGTVDDARSAAKELLSQPSKSSQLRLWLSYAALESAVGNGGEGKRVLEKAVGLASQLTPEQSKHKYYLWATLALLACPPGSAATSHEALHCLISSVETGQPFTTFAKAMKKLDEPQKLVTAPRLLKARTSFQQMWRSECEGMVASIRGLISSWLRSCSSASSQSPELVFPSGTPSTGLFCLTDLSISGESHLFPLAAFVLCSSLFELHTQGVSGVCAVCSRGVRTFRGLAAAFGRAKSCVSRGDSVAEAQSSVDATLSHWLNESNNEWCASLASIGRTSILLEQQGSTVTFDDSRLLEVFPVDATDSVGAAIDALLVNCEWLYVWWAQLLHSHANTSAHSPRILRHMLEEALSSFPANPTLLSLYTAPERNVLHASVRIRQFLEKFLDLPDCPAVLWYHVISSELTRATHTTGDASESAEAPSVEIVSVQRLHRLFEQALATPTGQKSVLLWRLYLRFELVSGNAIGAKKVLLRALNHCPWSKSLWCDTVRRMRPYLTQQEQTDLLRVMAEKGLRLRTPLRTTKAEA